MTSMNISLPEELKDYVEQKTKTGYSTPSEFMRELIREDQKRQTKDRLDDMLLKGLESGSPMKIGPNFWIKLQKEALLKLRKERK